jgi:hypothetical protein
MVSPLCSWYPSLGRTACFARTFECRVEKAGESISVFTADSICFQAHSAPGLSITLDMTVAPATVKTHQISAVRGKISETRVPSMTLLAFCNVALCSVRIWLRNSRRSSVTQRII